MYRSEKIIEYEDLGKYIDKRVRSGIFVIRNHFRFVPGRLTKELIFFIKQIVEKIKGS